MNLTHSLARASIRAAGALTPQWGAAIALPLFARIARTRPVRPEDEPTMFRARRGVIRIPGVDRRGVDVAVYEWGTGDRVAVLAHGWDGRASQFATLVRELVAEGFRVLAFDAPAHGDSGGRRSYLVDWMDALETLQQSRGRFALVVGHSFGGLATLVSVAGGVDAERVVTVAAPASAEGMLAEFQRMMGYSDEIARAFPPLFAARYFPGDRDPFAWLSAVRRPLPAGTPLLIVHDERDRTVPFREAALIEKANPGSRTIATKGLGHTRILRSDAFLDAVLEFAATPAPAPAPQRLDAVSAHERIAEPATTPR